LSRGRLAANSEAAGTKRQNDLRHMSVASWLDRTAVVVELLGLLAGVPTDRPDRCPVIGSPAEKSPPPCHDDIRRPDVI